MKLTVQAHPKHAVVLQVDGSLDGATYGHLLMEAQQLLAEGTRLLVLDFARCDYMSSAGLMALTSIFKQMRELSRNEAEASWATKNVLERAGELGPARQLVIVSPCPPVERVLTLAGVQSYIPIHQDVAQALAKQ